MLDTPSLVGGCVTNQISQVCETGHESWIRCRTVIKSFCGLAALLAIFLPAYAETADQNRAILGSARDDSITAPLVRRSSVTKDGITWTFSQSVRVGKFVNGDYFVVGPVTITSILPQPTTKKPYKNGSVV